MKEYLVKRTVEFYYSIDADDDAEAVDIACAMPWDSCEDYNSVKTEVTLIDDGEC